MDHVITQTVQKLKALYAQADQYCTDAPIAIVSDRHLSCVSSLAQFVINNPRRLSGFDDDIVTTSLTNDYRKISKQFHENRSFGSNDIGLDCISHIIIPAPMLHSMVARIVKEINSTTSILGYAIQIITGNKNQSEILLFSSSYFSSRLEADLESIYRSLILSGMPMIELPVYRYFSPILAIGEDKLLSPVTRAERFIKASNEEGIYDISGIIPLIGQATTFVDDFNQALQCAINDSMRYFCHLDTRQSFILNPLIAKKIYTD